MEISLTDFVDFTLKTGSSRVAKVRELKRRPPGYDPATDFWKALREAIIEFHRSGTGIATLDAVASGATPRRTARYADAIAGYKKFLKKKDLKWFAPRSSRWTEAGLVVKVNPELGLVIGATPSVVKLYFKTDAPTRSRVQAVLGMMEAVLPLPRSGQFAVLDVANGRLMPPGARWSKDDTRALLSGEAHAFVEIWHRLR